MTTPMGARKKLTRRVETAGSVVAGGAGASFGAAKLRDTHVAQYGKTHVHTGAKTLAHVVPPRTAVKLATRNPGFKTLAIGSAAGAVAAAADHYGDHLNRKQRRMAAQAKKEPTVSKSAFLEEPISKAKSDKRTAALGVAGGAATVGGLHLGNKADEATAAAGQAHTTHEIKNANERATRLFPIQGPSKEATQLGRKATKLRRGSTAGLAAGAALSAGALVSSSRAKKKLVAKRDEKVSAFGVRHP